MAEYLICPLVLGIPHTVRIFLTIIAAIIMGQWGGYSLLPKFSKIAPLSSRLIPQRLKLQIKIQILRDAILATERKTLGMPPIVWQTITLKGQFICNSGFWGNTDPTMR
jgi:hypothetical protein